MSDTKITALSADTAPTQDDLIVTVNDPAGTPANRKVALADLVNKSHETAAYASLPSAAWTGRLGFPSDGVAIYRDSGSAWVPWGPLYPLTDPTLQTFAWKTTQGTATIATTKGGIYLSDVSAGTAHVIRMRGKSAPSTPYTITALITYANDLQNFSFLGLAFRQSSDGKLVLFGVETMTGGVNTMVGNFTDANNNSSYPILSGSMQLAGRQHWLQIADNGTNRICSYSADGQNWVTVHSVGRTSFLTANEVGFFVNPFSSDTGMMLHSWKEG